MQYYDNETAIKRFRKWELENAVKEFENRGYEVVLPIQKASDYYKDCLAHRVKKYYKVDGVSTYQGYICVLVKKNM